MDILIINRQEARQPATSGRARRLLALACTVWLAASANAQLPCSYSVTVLPNSPCFNFQSPANPVAINNLGHVLLWGANCGEPGYHETYLWTGGPALATIPRPAGMLGFTGADLNDGGVIVGEAQYASPTGPRAMVYDGQAGQWTILPPLNPPTGWSSATAINNNEEVCGFRSVGNPGDPVNPQMAFRWSASGGFQDFGLVDGRNTAGRDINNSGVTTVSSGLGTVGAFAYVWTAANSTIIHPPGCLSSDAGRLTDSEAMTTGGLVQINPIQTRGFIVTNGVYTECTPMAGATSSSFGGIAECGLVSGRSNFGSASNSIACLWVNGLPINLNTMLPAGFAGTLKDSRISRNGHVVARGQFPPSDNRVFMLTPVMPEPGDTNCDGQVDVTDLLQVITTWGPCAGCRSDISGDGNVNVNDLLQVILNWGT